MPLTCIRKRSTDGLRCEGTWAWRVADRKTAWGSNLIIIPGLATVLPIENLPLTRVLIRVRYGLLQERHRTGLSREQKSLWLAGYPKTPGFDVQFGSTAAASSRHHRCSS